MKTSINLFLVYSIKLLHLVQDPFGVLAIRPDTWALLRFEENQGRILISHPSKLVNPSCIYCSDSHGVLVEILRSYTPKFPIALVWSEAENSIYISIFLPFKLNLNNITDQYNIWAYKSTLNINYPFNRNNQGS